MGTRGASQPASGGPWCTQPRSALLTARPVPAATSTDGIEKKKRMIPVGTDPSARALAHYSAAQRHMQFGHTQKASAHIGRAMHYTNFGGDDDDTRAVDAITTLLWNKVPITEVHPGASKSHFRSVRPEWKLYFEPNPESRSGIKATSLLNLVINKLNGKGQSILYCAYRFMCTSPDFVESRDYIMRVPGIDLGIKNAKNPHGEVDMALSGLAADHPSLSFILDQVQDFGRGSEHGARALHDRGCNVFGIIDMRIRGSSGYRQLDPVA